MKSYIHFIRHSITEGNQKGWFYGQMDIPIAEEGFAKIEELKAQGIYPPLENADCYTSGMLRAEQTFQAIYGDVPRLALPLMREINFGDWEGHTYEELKSMPGYDDWMSCTDNTFCYPGGGDSILSFYTRIREGLKDLEGRHRLKELSHRHSGQDAVSIIVCHGGVIAASMSHHFPADRENFWQWIPDPGHGYTVYYEDGEAVRFEPF